MGGVTGRVEDVHEKKRCSAVRHWQPEWWVDEERLGFRSKLSSDTASRRDIPLSDKEPENDLSASAPEPANARTCCLTGRRDERRGGVGWGG
jgi:hypothetical protein